MKFIYSENILVFRDGRGLSSFLLITKVHVGLLRDYGGTSGREWPGVVPLGAERAADQLLTNYLLVIRRYTWCRSKWLAVHDQEKSL
jgi:hypothetical protein